MSEPGNESHTRHTSSFTELAENLQTLTSTLADHGLRVSGSGRFPEYERCIARALSHSDGHVAVSDENAPLLHRAMIDTHELSLIVEELSRDAGVPGWKEKAQDALGGRAVSGDDTNRRDHARNIQFELYLAAVAKKAGFQVQLVEPDVLSFDEDLGNVALAAKRIQSARKIRRNIRKANNQLRDSGNPGIVAIDVTCAVPKFSSVRTGESDDSVGAELNADVRSYVEQNQEIFYREIDTNSTYALLVHVAAPCVVANGQRLGNNRVLRWLNFCSSESQEGAIVLAFKNKLSWSEEFG